MSTWWGRRRRLDDLADEIRANLALEADQLVADGASPDDARRIARRRFGSVTAVQERFYEAHRWLWLDHLVGDVRCAARNLRKYPIASAVAILSLAGGIGSTTAMLTVRSAVFRAFPPLFRQPENLSRIDIVTPQFRRGPAVGLYQTWQRDRTLDAGSTAATLAARGMEIRTDERSESGSQARGESASVARHESWGVRPVSANLFDVLGVRAAIGRTFTDADRLGAPAVVVPHVVWQRMFDGRADVIGRTLWMADKPYTVVGVLPEPFWLIETRTLTPIFTLLDLSAVSANETIELIVRRSPGVSVRSLADGLRPGLSAYLAARPQTERRARIEIDDFRGTPLTRQMQLSVPVLFVSAVLMTLFISCVSVAIIVIAQWTTRERELAVRASLGASRARIVRLLLTESVLMASCGGALGILATYVVREILLIKLGRPVAIDVSVDVGVFLSSSAVAVLAGVVAGIGPALVETRRLHVNPLRSHASERVRQRWRHTLVVSEIAVTAALLVVTAAMLSAYRRALAADVGFPARSLLIVGVTNADGVAVQPVLAAITDTPGVTAVAAGTSIPFVAPDPQEPVALEPSGAAIAKARLVGVTAAFFSTLGVPLRAGRALTADEVQRGALVAVVNVSLAAELFGDRNPIGARIWFERVGYEVVGVAADYSPSPIGRTEAMAFMPLPRDRRLTNLPIIVRTTGAEGPIVAALRREIPRVGSNHVVTQSVPADQVTTVAGEELRVGTYPLVPLITIGLVLTATGIYSVLAFAIARRSKELALRSAIGASPTDLLRLVAGSSLRLVAAGVLIGVVATFALTRLLQGTGSVFESPGWQAFVAPMVIVGAVSVLAMWVPALRVLRIQPAVLLRTE